MVRAGHEANVLQPPQLRGRTRPAPSTRTDLRSFALGVRVWPWRKAHNFPHEAVLRSKEDRADFRAVELARALGRDGEPTLHPCGVESGVSRARTQI